MAKREQWWVAKRDMTMAGQKVNKGQLIRPAGSPHDHIIFGDNTRWSFRYDGTEPIECETDGCLARFDNLGSLQTHRQTVHGPDRDARMQAEREHAEARREAEEAGDTIGGLEITGEKTGPGGKVAYVKHPMTA